MDSLLASLLSDVRVVHLNLTKKFRNLTVREVALIKGAKGWGEFGPFLEYDDRESSRWLLAAIEAAEIGWPSPIRTKIPVNATIPAVTPEEAIEVFDSFGGCRCAKVKVAQPGQSLSDDLDRLRALKNHAPDGTKFRVDANGAWSVSEAEQAVAAIHEVLGDCLEYVEQPCATVDELAALRPRISPVLIAADESIRKSEDPLRVARAGAADIAIVKVAPLGGVAAALKISAAAGLPTVVSSALESGVGMRAGLALAAALPNLPYACGLATTSLFTDDLYRFAPVNGEIELSDLSIHDSAIERLSAPVDRVQWWRERITRTWSAGTAELVAESGWSW
ncbi:MAG TPA: o-succinylbenzoate synthase [Candidatus Nanopelagicaceae bacterium]|nr:o-succinylbenzoate synthase [Candidatus Nanopelagicaceae bacterium]